METSTPIPITVLGGYLGAGKTTLVNSLLTRAAGRRIGVVVNDFGALGVDAALLEGVGADGLVSLANGCVCCTLGADLHDALTALAARRPVLDDIVVEASGVADPAVAAAWGTSAGFAVGGVVVVVAADAVRERARDRYVGDDVTRQIRGADLLVVTKTDRCDDASLAALDAWLGDLTAAPRIRAVHGDIAIDAVLGPRAPGRLAVGPDARAAQREGQASAHGHDDGPTDRYATRSRTSLSPISEGWLAELRRRPPVGLLRLKAVGARPGTGTHLVVHCVGSAVDVRVVEGERGGSMVSAIGVAGRWDAATLDGWAGDES